MDILGIGFPELIFIMVIALMVFGPRRLPEMAAKAGKLVADLRNMSNGLLSEWQRELRASELQEELTRTRQELAQARDTVSSVSRQVKEETADVAKTITPPKVNVGQVLSEQAASLEQAVTEPPPATDAPSPETPATNNGSDTTPTSNPEKTVNEQ